MLKAPFPIELGELEPVEPLDLAELLGEHSPELEPARRRCNHGPDAPETED